MLALPLVLGALRSILRFATVALVWLPARSLTEALAERLMPSPVAVLSSGQVPSMPDKASAQAQCMITSPLYHPAAFACVVAAPLSVGAVVSILISPMLIRAL